ncbi:calcineurin-binding protein cabin-1 [Trichinella spiralis]|nr:calcineurin-binding protein cabin-1 [Trichinella spiralis]
MLENEKRKEYMGLRRNLIDNAFLFRPHSAVCAALTCQ